jgi:predicted signal transduction protein with EAL and GGDEF domain
VRADDVVARLGGDEFMVLLNEISDAEEVRGVARNLVAILGIPVELNGHECHVTGSIGIAIFPQDGTDVDTLMRHADTAMYLAKTEGKNDVRFFSADIGAQSSGRLAMEADLRQALHRGEFTLVYQPKVDVESRQISGVEALLRWNHPTMGMISPMDFIPVAEETGLIIAIGRWVLNTACLQFTRWQAEALPVKSIAVNVSPRQFSDEYLLADIDSALGACGMDPRHLQIEITENMVLLNVERAIRTLNAIQSRGVRVAIDDFGTGYSSMSMLKRFPIDIIKIDQSFVRDLPHNAADNAIARAIIDMGKALGLMIVAEGVETPEQNAFLRVHACDEVQGFLFSKPVAASEILALFKIQDQAALAAGTDVRSQA